MNNIIRVRRLNYPLKAFIPILLFVFFLVAGIPLQTFSSEQQKEPSTTAADTPKVSTDAADVAVTPSTGENDTAKAAAAAEVQAEEPFNAEPSHENIARGERFFKGLLPAHREFEACVSCHNINHSDTLNWNPSAMDIATKYASKDFNAFISAVMQPSGTRMTEAHKNFNIEENDLKTIKLYLDNYATKGPPRMGPTVTQLLLFLGLGVLLTLALLDLLFFHKIKYKIIPVLILLISLGIQLKMVAHAAIDLGRSKNYAPDQPIKFSHKIHAGDNKIDCKYCHHTAEFSKSAGIPSMNLCMNCHVLVREGSHSGKFEISKVIEANETKKPVEWIRIHNLPDHVFFSHAQHVGIGKVDCKQCHGPVETMDIMKQHSDLSMGWCINCHRETQVNFKENPYYDNYQKLHELIKDGKLDTVRAADVGANDCMRCHY